MLSGKRLAFRSVLVVEWDKTLKLASARKNVSDLCLQFHQILFYRIYSILFIDNRQGNHQGSGFDKTAADLSCHRQWHR